MQRDNTRPLVALPEIGANLRVLAWQWGPLNNRLEFFVELLPQPSEPDQRPRRVWLEVFQVGILQSDDEVVPARWMSDIGATRRSRPY